MTKSFLLALVFMALLSFTALADYSAVIEDLPLMPGMTEMKDQAVVFDKPGGRIVQTTVAVTAGAKEVGDFYAAALPPLGWAAAGNDVYTRASERLTIIPGDKTVQFKITPLEKGQ